MFIKSIEYPQVHFVQIIFNVFRQRPAELFFTEAKTAAQANENFSVSEEPLLPMTKMDQVKSVHEQFIRPLVHHRW